MEQRRNHVGKRLMEVTLDALEQQYGSKRSALAAQAHLQKFYAELGYVTTGAEYMLDGIPHVDMVLHR
jgi:ElaA protein